MNQGPIITLKPVYASALPVLIAPLYEADKDLPKYHYSGEASPDWLDMASCTLRRIAEMEEELPLKHFVVHHDYNHPIGYVSVLCRDDEKQYASTLVSFCIHPDYRTWDVLEPWLRVIDLLFRESTWTTLLREKNTRAISFFERNGFVKTAYDADNQQYVLCREQ